MPHDFNRFPELTNSQMELYYFESPHKQIIDSFRATVTKVIDGDTIRVSVAFRDFEFPIRFIDTDAPEMNAGGEESKKWLESMILNEEVDVIMHKTQRVDKWGRLLGIIYHVGLNVNEQSIRAGMATPFEKRNEGKIPNIEKVIPKWL